MTIVDLEEILLEFTILIVKTKNKTSIIKLMKKTERLDTIIRSEFSFSPDTFSNVLF